MRRFSSRPISAWVAEPGTYTLAIGASSIDTRQAASFELKQELLVEQAHKAVAPADFPELTK